MKTQSIYNFIKVCECGSMHKAAESLNISPQGLGKDIRSLEDELGVPLLNRSVEGVHLTEYGAEVFSHFKAILSEKIIIDQLADKYRTKLSSFKFMLEDFEISNYMIEGMELYSKISNTKIEPIIMRLSPHEAEKEFIAGDYVYRACMLQQCEQTANYPYEVIDIMEDYPVFNIQNEIAKKDHVELRDFAGLTILSYTYNDYYPWVIRKYFSNERKDLVQPVFKYIATREGCLKEVHKKPECVTFISDSILEIVQSIPAYKCFTDEQSKKETEYVIQTKKSKVNNELFEIIKRSTIINRSRKWIK